VNKVTTISAIALAVGLNACANKDDVALQPEVVYKTEKVATQIDNIPTWYMTMPESDDTIFSSGTAIAPDMQLAVDIAIMNAKTTLADRINGKMNNQTSINKEETGIDENNSITGQAEDTIVNIVGNTLVRHYIVDQVEIFYTHHKSYRAYVKVKVSKENVEAVIDEIKSNKKLTQISKKPNKLKSKVKEVLKNLD